MYPKLNDARRLGVAITAALHHGDEIEASRMIAELSQEEAQIVCMVLAATLLRTLVQVPDREAGTSWSDEDARSRMIEAWGAAVAVAEFEEADRKDE